MIKKLIEKISDEFLLSWDSNLEEYPLEIEQIGAEVISTFVELSTEDSQALYNFLAKIFGKERKLDREKVAKMLCKSVACNRGNYPCGIDCADIRLSADALIAFKADIWED